MTSLIPVFYHPNMVAPPQEHSPSASKPEPVVASWLRRFPVRIRDVIPVRRDELALAHFAEYVDAVLGGKRSNGFGNRDLAVAHSLHYTVGSMLTAARHVLRRSPIDRVGVSPTSGFHHAGYDFGGGFCTFNGLMVTVLALRRAGLVRRVAIIDCDAHYGDGTDDIIAQLELRDVVHFTAGARYSRPEQAPEFLAELRGICEHAEDTCDLALYQAGADPHVHDPLGGWLTTEQLRARDEIVFCTIRKTPLVWNLAGGYQREPDGTIPRVIELHDNTMRACVEASSAGGASATSAR